MIIKQFKSIYYFAHNLYSTCIDHLQSQWASGYVLSSTNNIMNRRETDDYANILWELEMTKKKEKSLGPWSGFDIYRITSGLPYKALSPHCNSR